MKNNSVYIKSVNPGYDSDLGGNFGDAIELFVPGASPENLVSLASFKINYTNSSGNESLLIKFPENFYAAGEVILLKYAKAPDAESANFNYTKTLAFKGGLTLLKDDEVVDAVCWNTKDCYKAFDSGSPTVLVRDAETGEFGHVGVSDYEVQYDEKNLYVEDEGRGEVVAPQCAGLRFSEILSYYAETKDEQFVELYNETAEQVLLDGCSLKYKNKTYPLNGIVKADGYFARYLTDFNVTKNPTNAGLLELVDVNGEVVSKLEYPNGQKKGTSYAWVGFDADGEELWHTTYAVTPGEPNAYQEYKTCEAGKVVNETTGNCVKVTEIVEKTCEAGQFLNPLTGRCKKIATTTTTACKEGYERNPETGRCIMVRENTGTTYSVESEEFEEGTSFVAIAAILIVVAVGTIYAVYEFRREILKLFRKVFRRGR